MCYLALHAVFPRGCARELRQNLSVYLARVKKGERLIVTEHRQVVAVLAPAEVSDEPLARLVTAGRATAARRSLAALPRPLAARFKRSLSESLREQTHDAV